MKTPNERNKKALIALSYVVLALGILFFLLTISLRFLDATWQELGLSIVVLLFSVALFYTMQVVSKHLNK